MPLVDCLALIPDAHKYVKDLIIVRIKEVQGTVASIQECCSITQKKIVQEKLEDPGPSEYGRVKEKLFVGKIFKNKQDCIVELWTHLIDDSISTVTAPKRNY